MILSRHHRATCRSSSDETGATIVENMLLLPLFLAILVISFDLLLMAVHVLTVRYSASRLVREASLGQMNDIEVRLAVKRFAGSLGVHIPDTHISMCKLDDYPCAEGVVTTGSPGDMVVLELKAPIRGIVMSSIEPTSLGRRVFDFRARAVAKREP